MCEATELRDFIFSRSREPEDRSKAPESVSETFTREDSPRSLDNCNGKKYILNSIIFPKIMNKTCVYIIKNESSSRNKK